MTSDPLTLNQDDIDLPSPQPARANPLLGALRALLATPGSHLRAVLLTQGLTALAAFPIVSVMFSHILRQAGVLSLNDTTFGKLLSSPASLGWIAGLIVFVSSWWLLEQSLLLTWFNALRSGQQPTMRQTLKDIGQVFRRRLRPQLLLLFPYAFLLVPLGSLGAATFVARGITLPEFIAHELQQQPLFALALVLITLGLFYLNLRLALIPYYLVCQPQVSITQTVRQSWQKTGPRFLWLLIAYLTVWFVSVATLRLAADFALTWVASVEIHWSAGAPFAAALLVTVVQALTLVISGVVSAVLLEVFLDVAEAHQIESFPILPFVRSRRSQLLDWIGAGLAVGVLVALTFVNILGFLSAPLAPRTAIIAHRGETETTVENTLDSLVAAQKAGADMVELDVMQTADGELVVFHDSDLRRLTGDPRSVADLTVDELQSLTLHASGSTSEIPTFSQFAARAKHLDMPLLVELKTTGRESGDYLGDVVEVLVDTGLDQTSAIQTFSTSEVAELKDRFPDLRVGRLTSFHRGTLDSGGADFIALEQTSYTPSLLQQARAQGIDLYLWTVTDPGATRQYLRDGVNGIIATRVEQAVSARTALGEEGRVALRLEDELASAISWW